MTKIFAHRGSSGTHPENTIAAIKEAERVGADGIEIDVHMTRDNQIVVIHDATVDRTTDGKGAVRDFTLDEIQQLDAGSWFAPEFSEETVPTLAEVLQIIQANQCVLNIELKNIGVDYPDFEERVVDEIEKFNLVNRVVISSFNHDTIKKIHELNPNIECAILYLEKLYQPWNYAQTVNAKGIHPPYTVTDLDLITNSVKNGIAVRVFTVNGNQQLERFMLDGCSAIITDFPEKALGIRKKLREEGRI